MRETYGSKYERLSELKQMRSCEPVPIEPEYQAVNTISHDHAAELPRSMTRRRFISNIAKGSALALGASALTPLEVLAANSDPKPIKGGFLPAYHVYSPAFKAGGPPQVYDQSTITDFDGVFASTEVTGWGRDNTARELYFRCDMRFMQGRYLDVDDAERSGSFGFISLKLFEPAPGEPSNSDSYSMQIHEYNPGYLGGWPDGVFFTKPAGSATMSGDPVVGGALYNETNLDIPDYGNFTNALVNGPTTPATTSFDQRWFPGAQSRKWIYTHPADTQEPDSYALHYWDSIATLEWEVRNANGFSFSSYKIGQYPGGRMPGQLFAVMGRERSGSFFSPFSPDDLGSLNPPTPGPGAQRSSRLADTGPAAGVRMGSGLLLAGTSLLIGLRRRSTDHHN